MKIYNFLILLLSLTFGLISCKEAIEVDPKQSIPSETALETMEDIQAGVFGVYATLRDVNLYGRDLIAVAEALADNTVHTNVSGLRNEWNNNIGAHMDPWEVGFYGVNRANLVLDAIDRIDAPGSWKDAWAGQVYFIRALLYFDMAKVYGYDPTAVIGANDRGTVPIYEKGVVNIDDLELVPRAPIAYMYDFIYKDLDSAYAKLSRNTVGAGPHRVTIDAVNALYSRVALFRGDYERVVNKVNAALANVVGSFQSNESYVNAWRAETHPESIFEVKFNVNENVGANNSLRATFTTRAFLQDQIPSTHGSLAVHEDLMDLYENNDVRKQLIIKGLGNNINRNEMTKFMSRGGVKDLDNVPVIRVSELYLNRAEAYFRLDEPGLARDDVNTIRQRAGLAATTKSGSDLFEEILLQRRLEFAFEGHRWFDLKRLGRNIVKSGRTLPFTDPRILARIPFREVNASENMIRQNRGY
ncbi:RagB/SusD family nutrient uptake outer membrane protein [Sphingobacterium sp. SGG-5]|uniref:RagB/SusD family nutrient uptake outer membrane protein n=1 Tax=Sphingobacterium sp. SGG-5 TaxID=2710881 RepID=UPI0013EBD7B6|nr:RagB/SusD family nutrient uptake outer membrane protein [Sphingobacterium sp. SGG-5]NGM60672.1 RagB/SusD family nutrient uptake outer membrane protein [Sphingobacterium sp. SGG-5]